jgi:hypothetical protein
MDGKGSKYNIMKKISTLLVLLAFAWLPFGCHAPGKNDPASASLTYKTSDYDGKMIRDWMQLGFSMVKENFLYGPQAARIYGYMGLTFWESVYGGIPNAKSLAGQINDYPVAATIDPTKVYDWGMVLCTAMRQIMPELMDNISANQRSEVSVLADLEESQMFSSPGITDVIRDNSKDLGTRVAQKIIARIKNDGRDIIRNIVPVIPTRDADHKWYWDPNTYHQKPVEPMWSTLRTFVTDNAQACETDPPFPYSEEQSSAYYKDAAAVYQLYPLSADRKNIAYHWDDGPGRTCSSAGHWLGIAVQMLEKNNTNLAQSAKALCMLGFTSADAYASSWYMKYKYFLQRPGTYIKEVIDHNWEAAIGTPPYPDFNSSSATMAGAASVTMISLFGDVPFLDVTNKGSALYTPEGGPFILPERQFASITQAALEEKQSRVYGGVNFPRACEMGYKAGQCIGNTVVARLDFGL